MDHTPSERIEWRPAPAEHFTGTVWTGPLSRRPGTLNALGVHFEPGARSDWHSHPDGQVLYVVSGSGRVGTADGATVEISPGDVVFAPPGERHWHGAGPHSPMTHLSLTTGGETQWSSDKVSDEEYSR
jgi:quercetin dioxygenase-like cupin family protein